MKTLFVGYPFHKYSRSTVFFRELIAKHSDQADSVYVDLGNLDSQIEGLSKQNYDTVFLFQTDAIAPLFLSRGIPVINIPMFDFARLMPKNHWQMMRGCHSLSFSQSVDQILTSAGLPTTLVKYFPPLKRSSLLLKTSEHLKVYFWERRPNFLNSDQISKMLKSSKYKVDLRVKRASDLAITEVIRGEKESLVSWSSNNNSEHLKNLEECDLFVSPREYEGIGIATLEALALGVPAISIRRPTINEYITHGKNGILFENVGDEINLDDFDIETLKQNALSMSQELQARWSDTSKTLILELIDRAKQSLAHANNKIEWDQRHTEMLRLFCTCNDDTIDQYAKYLESLT